MVGQEADPVCVLAVDAGERVVMFDRFRGVLDEVYGEGTWFKIPWLQTPSNMDIRTRPRVISSVTGTGDLQMVNISLRVLSRPDSTQLPWIVRVRSFPLHSHGSFTACAQGRAGQRQLWRASCFHVCALLLPLPCLGVRGQRQMNLQIGHSWV